MTITRLEWWLGIATVAGGLLLHALIPRYEWLDRGTQVMVRIDRWTGAAEIGRFQSGTGHWMTMGEIATQRERDRGTQPEAR